MGTRGRTGARRLSFGSVPLIEGTIFLSDVSFFKKKKKKKNGNGLECLNYLSWCFPSGLSECADDITERDNSPHTVDPHAPSFKVNEALCFRLTH